MHTRASKPISRNDRAVGSSDGVFDHSVSVGELAHELNSLLDGSIRSLALAEQSLDVQNGQPALDSVFKGLRMAKLGLRNMADLLDRALREPESRAGVFELHRTIGEVVAWVLQSVQPLALDLHVELTVQVAEGAASLPARSLGPVILNGVRNALRATAKSNQSRRTVEIIVDIDAEEMLRIRVIDDGPGLPENFTFGRTGEVDGHGIGLELSRRIASDLGGRISVQNSAVGHGTVMCVEVPCERLADS